MHRRAKIKDITKTAYDWCLEENFKVIGLEKYPMIEEGFYTDELDEAYFGEELNRNFGKEDISVEENAIHLKSEKYLELRMYSLVPYNLLGIQMGIQHEHSITNFVVKHVIDSDEVDGRYLRWAKEWKTSILLNGGTSNEGHYVRHGFRNIWYRGSMQEHFNTLKENGIKLSTFYEPDLNSMLTGISFIVDERVFNRRHYPDFLDYVDLEGIVKEVNYDSDKIKEEMDKDKVKWVEMIGGEQNAFLREFLSGFKLARG